MAQTPSALVLTLRAYAAGSASVGPSGPIQAKFLSGRGHESDLLSHTLPG